MTYDAELPTSLIARLLVRASSAEPTDESTADQQVVVPPPLAKQQLGQAEAKLGFALPGPLRQLWGEVGNGGYGPGYGITGLSGGHMSDPSGDVVSYHQAVSAANPDDESWEWPARMLAFCNWGCAINSCVDLTSSDLAIFRFDPNPVASDWRAAWFDEGCGLESWLRGWLDGEDLWMTDSIRIVEDVFRGNT